MSAYGILVDYEWCTGCHSCEIACQMEYGYEIGKTGILMSELGPWKIEGDIWQYDYIAVPTDMCDLCASRTAQGKNPSCVQACQASCMKYGTIEELYEDFKAKPKQALFYPKGAGRTQN